MIMPKASTVLAMALILALIPTGSAFSGAPTPGSHVQGGEETRALPSITGVNESAAPNPVRFSFVSNFEDGGLDGWSSVLGATPIVTSAVNYGGEPTLGSSALSTVQADIASNGFQTGATYVSFQVAIASNGNGVFGLGSGMSPLAVVGVYGSAVVAGPDLDHLVTIGTVPSGTAYPKGWVYLTADVYMTTASNNQQMWTMQVFIDGTEHVAATLSVPGAGGYTNALIETTLGVVYYSDIVVSTYQIPIYIPGYNNMEGYGQGSGLLVSLLPAYYNLTAQMDLKSWNVPQNGILSFQINAMNMTGTTKSTCHGFFQLGIDLDMNGRIAPWYVEGKNCGAVYFLPHGGRLGVSSPSPTHLVLSIVFVPALKQIEFTIKDTSIGKVFAATIPYRGGSFYGMYTQMEWQPCCSNYPIGQYRFDGSVYGIRITTNLGATEVLTSSYMLPFILDAPPSWNFGYYQDSMNGYKQVA